MSDPRHNWAGNVHYGSTRTHNPTTLQQLQEIVATSSRVKVYGARHSFNAITDTDADHICLDRMDHSLSFDDEQGTVTVSGGITYGRLCVDLHAAGRAIHNMASLPHITLAGAVSTATHGSGDGNGNLATAVVGLELVRADGELVTLSREKDGDEFAGAVVGLGALGIVHRMTLATEPAFVMQQEVYQNMPMDQANAHFDAIFSDAYSVSFFIDWQEERVNEVWLKRRLNDGVARPPAPTFFGGALATRDLHPIAEMDATGCTPQMGIPGPWHERLPHFLVDSVPASGNELQTEYFVDRKYAVEAMAAVISLREQTRDVLKISEVRTMAGDDLWLSMAYGHDTVALHFSWNNDWPAVSRLLPQLEERLAPYAPRPHWGKLATLSGAEIQARYPKAQDFRALAQRYDPQGKFRNEYLDSTIFA